MTKDARWPVIKTCQEKRESKSTLLIRTAHGNAASTRTRTDCCDNICPREKTSATTPRTNSTTSPPTSTPDQESHWDGKLRRNCSYPKVLSISRNTGQLKSTLLHLELESARLLPSPLQTV